MGGGGSGGSAGVQTTLAGNAGTSGLAGASCEVPQPGSSPMSRLTNPELEKTLGALVGNSGVEGELTSLQAGHYEESPSVDISPETIEKLHRLAHNRARDIAADPAQLKALLGCDLATSSEAACQDALYDGFVARAFRRPLTDDDRGEMNAVFDDGKALGGSFASGARAVIEVALQSPELTYLVTEGEGSLGDLVPLTGYETASRLSYFLTGAPPDDALWQAASAGPLENSAIAAHAQRLLGSSASRAQLRRFYQRELGLEQLEPSDVTGFSSELAALAEEAGLRFVEDVTFESAGTFHDLLTSPIAFMNGTLAQFYGVPDVVGSELERITLDPSQRRGLLTQPAFLRATSPGPSTRPVLRGIEVLRTILCVELPAPPASIPTLAEPSDPNATMRERLMSATASSPCSSCHGSINPIGLAFENYDAFGRYRESENGFPIDASGTLNQTDAAGSFTNAVELIERIAASKDAARCFQKHWLSEAYRRKIDADDECELSRVATEFDQNGGKLQQLVVSVAQSANLKYRPKSE